MDQSTSGDVETLPTDGGAAFAPTFDQTISRALVHKAGPEAVWLSEIVRVGDHRYRCAGQVPRANTFVNDSIPPLHTYYDLGFLTELGRQAGISTLHEFEDVPVDWATVFLKYDVSLAEPLPNDRTPAPVPAIVDVSYHNHQHEQGRLTVFAEMSFAADGVHRATSTSLASAHEKAPYKAWRTQMRAAKPLLDEAPPLVEAIAPERVGRRDPDNVMIGELEPGDEAGSFGCRVRVDQLHPHFFEHSMDHVPGVVHVEVFRQAALAAADMAHGTSPVGATVVSCSIRFAGFAELELPLECHVRVAEAREQDDGSLHVPVRLSLSQPDDPSVTTGDLVLRALR